MKRIYKVWVDGEYMTPEKARRLHPEGFDTTFTKTEYIEDVPERIRGLLPMANGIMAAVAVFTMAAVCYIRI